MPFVGECCRIATLHSKLATIEGSRAGIPTLTQQAQSAETSAGGGTSYSIQSASRRLLVGSGTYATTNFALRAVNFLLITVFTRYLSPGDYGTISLAEIIAATLATFCGLGLDAAVRRLYFHYADEPAVQRRYVSSVLRFGTVLTTAIVAFGIRARAARAGTDCTTLRGAILSLHRPGDRDGGSQSDCGVPAGALPERAAAPRIFNDGVGFVPDDRWLGANFGRAATARSRRDAHRKIDGRSWIFAGGRLRFP